MKTLRGHRRPFEMWTGSCGQLWAEFGPTLDNAGGPFRDPFETVVATWPLKMRARGKVGCGLGCIPLTVRRDADYELDIVIMTCCRPPQGGVLSPFKAVVANRWKRAMGVRKLERDFEPMHLFQHMIRIVAEDKYSS